MNPIVSVIIPTYKGSDVVERAVKSVLSQTYQPVEIIVVDDNGLEAKEQLQTESVLKPYIESKEIIYIPHKVNKNGSAARNTGVYASSGKYITLLDDDDIYYPNKVELQVKELDSLTNEYGLVYCSIECDYGDKLLTSYATESGDLFEKLLYHDVVIGSDTLMVRRNVYLELNGFDESFKRHQDFEFTARVAKMWRIKAINHIGVRSFELNRNAPKDKEQAIQYRKHYIDKMLSYFDDFSKQKKKKIIGCNYIMLYGPELRGGSYFAVYKDCRKLVQAHGYDFTMKDYICSIIHIIISKNKKKKTYRRYNGFFGKQT